MKSLSDQELLRQYTEHRSETAFTELVHRHLDLVYSSALRIVCEPHHLDNASKKRCDLGSEHFNSKLASIGCMCRTVTMPLTDADRVRLLDWLPKSPPWYRGHELDLVAYGFASLILIPIFCVAIYDVGWQPRSLILGVGVVFFIGYWVSQQVLKPCRAFKRKDSAMRALRESLRTAECAQVQRVVASEVVEILAPEGNFYLFSTGESECVWVQPEKLCKDWPNSSFAMIKVPGIDREFGPFCDGARLAPKKRVRFDTYFEEFDFDLLPEDGVIAQSASAFLQAARTSSKLGRKMPRPS